MQDRIKLICVFFVALFLISMSVIPLKAWVYPSGPQDNNFEAYGPHIDQLLIKKYAGVDAEMAALQSGEIDLTDSTLSQAWKDTFATDPNIGILESDSDTGYYTISFNHNNNLYLGNPPDPVYPNPENPNPQGNENPTSVPAFRQAISHLIDRVSLAETSGPELYEHIFTPIPAYMDEWIHPDIRPGGSREDLTYPPSRDSAATILDANGFPFTGSDDSCRYWDRNHNGAEDPGEDLVLDIVTSKTPSLRVVAGDMLTAAFNDSLIRIKYVRTEATTFEAYEKVAVQKDFNIYTAGWLYVGPDPEHIWDFYNSVNYRHPGGSNNFGFVDDALTNTYSTNIEYAENHAYAVSNCLLFQERFAEIAAEVPLASTIQHKAYHKTYVGTGEADGIEDVYEGAYWTHLVNEKSVGPDNRYTLLNAYPLGHEIGSGDMTLRYGWSDSTMPEILNPLFSWNFHEREILNIAYDSLARRNPHSQGPVSVPYLAENWAVGSWFDPGDGKTKISVDITVRQNVMWSDEQPFDINDVIYTFIDLPTELANKGMSGFWWQPIIDEIARADKLSDSRVIIFLRNNNTLCVQSLLENIIIPKHLWQPFIAANDPASIAGDLRSNPTMLTGTGPFRFVSDDGSTLIMERNPTYYYQNPFAPGQSATIYTDSQPSSFEAGENFAVENFDVYDYFRVDVYVADVANLWAWDIGIQWDPEAVQYVSFSWGDFQSLAIGGGGNTVRWEPIVDEAVGKTSRPAVEAIVPNAFSHLPIGGISAPLIKLFSVTMIVVGLGPSTLSLTDISLKSQDPDELTTYPRWSDADQNALVDIFDIVMTYANRITPGLYPLTMTDFNDDMETDLTDLAIVTSDFGKIYSGPEWGVTRTIRDIASVYDFHTINHEVIVDKVAYTIQTVSNSTVEAFGFDYASMTLTFSAAGPPGTRGFCEVILPKQLMTLGFGFAVLVNGAPIPYDRAENATHVFLYFIYNHSTDLIAILETIRGDLNGDRIVDIFDIVIVAVAFGSTPSDANWNRLADVTRDSSNTIDIFDIAVVALQFNHTYP